MADKPKSAEEWLEMTGRVDAEWQEMIPVLESYAAYIQSFLRCDLHTTECEWVVGADLLPRRSGDSR